MAKIVIDCRMWAESGNGRYLRNLVKSLIQIDQENEYFLLLLKKDFGDKLLSGSRVKSGMTSVGDKEANFHKILADFKWYGLKEQFELPKLLRKINPDLVHFPHFNVPIFYQGKFVVTIHDLIHQHFSMARATLHNPLTHRIKQFGYKQTFRSATHDSARILTPSEFVKKQLMSEWNVPEKKIVVTPEGVDEDIERIANRKSEKNEKVILNRLGIMKPYIFYIGNAHPHKNVETLIRAFRDLKISVIPGAAGNQDEDNKSGSRIEKLQLVLAGKETYFWKRLKNEFKGVEGIIFTGQITDEEMVAVYKNAEAFVMPSFEEGFGLPILEAFVSGCPVVVSKQASLPEVGGDAAIYFDPRNIEDLKIKLLKVLTDVRQREKMIKKGFIQAKKFSWQKMAEETLQVYKQSM